MSALDWPSAIFSTVLVIGGPLLLWLGLGHDSQTQRPPSQGWADHEGTSA